MKSSNLKTTVLLSTIVIFILACGFPSTGKKDVIPTDVSVDSAPPTEIPTHHEIIPVSLPAERSSHAGDFDSSTTADKKSAAGGDRFTFGRFERPFNANTMDVYFPEIDIIDTSVLQDETWIYGKITVKGNEGHLLTGKYAIELDLNIDGKGDWLIIVNAPTSTDWTTDGIQAYHDANKGVGDLSAMYTDENAVSTDGFEQLVFDQGQGADADAAWVRVSPEDPNTVEISVKRALLGNPEKYLINMWAGNSLVDPKLFDINDYFTHEQAGAADPGFELFYPIKGVSEIDNSCRMAVGFEPTGLEPGLCEVFVPNEVIANSPQGCTASPRQILACSLNSDPSYSCGWNSKSCTCECEYIGPK